MRSPSSIEIILIAHGAASSTCNMPVDKAILIIQTWREDLRMIVDLNLAIEGYPDRHFR